MRNVFKISFSFLILSLFLVSCGEDSIINPTVNPPVVNLASGTGITSGDATLNIGESFTVQITASKGTNPMKSLTIEDAGSKIDISRLTFSTGGGGNPLLLTGATSSALDIKITIKVHTDVSTKAYKFTVADDAGNQSGKTINITTKGTPPIITEPSVDHKVDVNVNALFSTKFKVAKGTAPLQSIEVLIDDVRAKDSTRFFYQELTKPFNANPFTIPVADKDNLEKDIIIRAPLTPGIYKYTIKFIDATGLSSSKNITATVGKKVTMLQGILLNQSGPDGQGGLDLDTGKSTGTVSSDPSAITAEIRDEGILNLTNDPTWKQQISGMNGSLIKYIIKGKNGIPETFKFEDVTFSEQIASLFTNGTNFTQKSTSGNRDVSDKVAVGDVFVVKNGDKHFLLIVKNVKITTTDNLDSYTFDVKL
ncbi:MAG: hypothetical protein IPO37_18135 [Saprospiraceae bacterium]|jgi:hypothetical protein|nr:hypothetical protein [Saprospiraceae bacterium]